MSNDMQSVDYFDNTGNGSETKQPFGVPQGKKILMNMCHIFLENFEVCLAVFPIILCVFTEGS